MGMLKQKARLISALVFIVDLLLAVLSFYLAYPLRHIYFPSWFPRYFPTGLYPWELYIPLLVWILPIFSYLLWSQHLYASHRTHRLFQEIKEVIQVTLLCHGFLWGIIVFLKKTYISRSFLGLFFLLNLLFWLGEKLTLRWIAQQVRRRGFNFRNLLIIGDGPKAVQLAQMIRQNPHWGYRFLGYVSDGPKPLQEPHLGKLEDLPQILTNTVVDDVIFVAHRRKLEDLSPWIALCQELGIYTRIALHTLPRMASKLTLEEIDHTPMVALFRIPTNLVALGIKRTMDILGSLVGLILTAPLMVLIAMAIKLDSPGPILFTQRRCGLNGRKFTLYKFRTMVKDADQRKDEVVHLNEMDGPVFKAKKDPRITRVGKILRRFSLDELPQLWNVFKGEMSLVGPRPPLPEEVEKYEKWQRRRLSMKPGITCLWQISGRSKLDFQTWMALDLKYIDEWSLSLDLKILLKTIPAVIFARGAR